MNITYVQVFFVCVCVCVCVCVWVCVVYFLIKKFNTSQTHAHTHTHTHTCTHTHTHTYQRIVARLAQETSKRKRLFCRAFHSLNGNVDIANVVLIDFKTRHVRHENVGDGVACCPVGASLLEKCMELIVKLQELCRCGGKY